MIRNAGFALSALLLTACGYGPDSEAGACSFGSVCQGSGQASAGAVVDSGFFRSGAGDSVLLLPAAVQYVRVTASVQSGASAYILAANGQQLTSALLTASGRLSSTSGVYPVPAGATLTITGSTAAWSVGSVLLTPPPENGAAFSASGKGEAVLLLPLRVARYRIEGRLENTAAAFIASSGGQQLFAELLSEPGRTSHVGTYELQAGVILRVSAATGVAWTVAELR